MPAGSSGAVRGVAELAFIKSAVYRRLAAADLVIALIPRRLLLRHAGCRHPVHSARRGGPAALPSRSSAPYSRRNCQFMNSSEDDRPGSDDFRFPCRFPAKPSIIAEPDEQVYDLTGIFGTGKPKKNFQFFPGFSLCGRERKRRSCPRQRNAAAVLPPSRQPRPDHAAHRRGTACAAPAAWGFERTDSAPAQLPGLGAPSSANRPLRRLDQIVPRLCCGKPERIRVGPFR